MGFYEKMFSLAIPKDLGRWDKNIIIGDSEDGSNKTRQKAVGFWGQLIS